MSRNAPPLSSQIIAKAAEIGSIQVDRRKKNVRLELFHGSGDQSAESYVELQEVLAFRIGDFGLYNQVSRVMQSCREDFSRTELVAWIQWATTLPDGISFLDIELTSAWLDALESDMLHLLVIELTVGTHIAAVSKCVMQGLGRGRSVH